MTRSGLSWLASGVTFMSACGLALVVAGSDLEALFGPIDDHEPLSWLGADGRITPAEAVSTLVRDTELGQWPDAARYRPVYFALRMSQALLFGDNVRLWYLSVLLLYALTCTIGGVVFAQVLDRALVLADGWRRSAVFVGSSIAGMAAWSGMSAWAGIVGRLGPSESLGLLGLAVALLGMVRLAFEGARWWWAVLLLGVYVSVWSKESFVAVVGAAVLTAIYLYLRDRRLTDLLLGGVSLVPVFILVPVLVGTSADIYGRPVGMGRVEVAFDAIFRVFLGYWGPAAAILVMTGLGWAWTVGVRHRLAIGYVFSLTAWVIGLLMLDVYVQGGEYVHPRYWAVFDASKTLMILAALVLAVAAFRRSGSAARWVSGALLVMAAFMVMRLGTGIAQGWSAIATEARANSEATRQFSQGVNAFLEQAGTGSMGVVITHPVEYEPSRAILQRLYFATGTDTRRFLLPMAYEQDDDATWESLLQMSQAGYPAWHVASATPAPAPGSLACVFVNVDPFPVMACDPDRSLRVDARGM